MNEQNAAAVFGSNYIGCIIDGSAQSADYINEETIDFAKGFGFDVGEELDEESEDYSQLLSETADDAVTFLNDQDTLSYCWFSHDDNSLFYGPSIESVKEDVGFVSSRDEDYPADDYEGEWLHVSDHGNATLYIRENGQDKEIWGVA